MCWQTKSFSNLKVLSSEMDPVEIRLISYKDWQMCDEKMLYQLLVVE
jgi:hypothetical protein